MTTDSVQQDVRRFYDKVGWREISEGVYQNAQYEDLRPVSSLYIHRCHLRVNRQLIPNGKYFLDAGSGPVQYPEYLTYSRGYQFRVCLDISIVALRDARKRIGDKGLFVVGDIAHLPFRKEIFDGIVSLHTIHHVPENDYLRAYLELKRVLSEGRRAVVVNGWKESTLMRFFKYPILLMERFQKKEIAIHSSEKPISKKKGNKPEGTFVKKLDAENLRNLLKNELTIDIKVWRSVSVRFLRAMIHPWFFGRIWLNLLYLLEEISPRFFGEKGQYPLIIFQK
jgi:SAM-dependent methyltransferase